MRRLFIIAALILTVSLGSFPIAYGQDKDSHKNILLLTSLERPSFYLPQILESYWDIRIQEKNINDYSAGEIQYYDALIVINENNASIPSTLLYDMRNSFIQIAWIGYGFDDLLPLSNLKPLDFTPKSIRYKDREFHAENLQITNLFPSVVAQQNNIETLAWVEDAIGSQYPLIVHANKRYLFIPFHPPFFYQVSDFSLVFLDALHVTLGHVEKPKKRALLRLEDVNVYTYRNTAKLEYVYSYLKEKRIPFHIALIPRYRNPEKSIDMELQEGHRFFRLIKRMVADGLGTLVQHGYTHQVGNEISGDGFEFWDASTNAPLSNDSEELVRNTVEQAQDTIRRSGLPVPDIWETPHYALSELDDRVINSLYSIRYEHIQERGALPFVATINNTTYIPENLGYLFTSEDDLKEIEDRLDKLSAFEDPVASVFWHPWRSLNELKRLVSYIEGQGYTFVSAYDLLETPPEDSTASLAAFQQKNQGASRFTASDYAFPVLYFIFFVGVFFYLLNIYRIRKYTKLVQSTPVSVAELKTMAIKSNQKLPTFAIFVPARNERDVIANTIRNLVRLSYPKENYRIFIIVDAREEKDGVQNLTKDVVKTMAKKLQGAYGKNFVSCIEVPKWYSGVFQSQERTYEQSTKGRALNYALQYLLSHASHASIDMLAILDADGRLHRNVLRDAAHKRLAVQSKLLQGPVLQITNFSEVSITGIAASLELAVHHFTQLPDRLLATREFHFLAGTNYIIDKNLIQEVGAWNQHALVEDAELALRIYEQKGITAQWLNSVEQEQTPPSFRVYRRQRERWARGHLYLLSSIAKTNIPLREKIALFNRIATTQYRVLFDLGLPILAIVLMIAGAFQEVGLLFTAFSIVLIAATPFVWDLYGFMYRTISSYINPKMKLRTKLFVSAKLFLFVPVFMVIQTIPKIEAIINYTFRPKRTEWYKTERTKEV